MKKINAVQSVELEELVCLGCNNLEIEYIKLPNDCIIKWLIYCLFEMTELEFEIG